MDETKCKDGCFAQLRLFSSEKDLENCKKKRRKKAPLFVTLKRLRGRGWQGVGAKKRGETA